MAFWSKQQPFVAGPFAGDCVVQDPTQVHVVPSTVRITNPLAVEVSPEVLANFQASRTVRVAPGVIEAFEASRTVAFPLPQPVQPYEIPLHQPMPQTIVFQQNVVHLHHHVHHHVHVHWHD